MLRNPLVTTYLKRPARQLP